MNGVLALKGSAGESREQSNAERTPSTSVASAPAGSCPADAGATAPKATRHRRCSRRWVSLCLTLDYVGIARFSEKWLARS